MKKIFTLAFAFGIMTVTFAQSRHSDNRYDSKTVVVTTTHNSYNGRGDFDRQKAEMIAKINREFDMKIMQVSRNRYLRSWEKKRQINFLGQQRSEQIKEINARFASFRGNRFDDDHRGWK